MTQCIFDDERTVVIGHVRREMEVALDDGNGVRYTVVDVQGRSLPPTPLLTQGDSRRLFRRPSRRRGMHPGGQHPCGRFGTR